MKEVPTLGLKQVFPEDSVYLRTIFLVTPVVIKVNNPNYLECILKIEYLENTIKIKIDSLCRLPILVLVLFTTMSYNSYPEYNG